MRRLLRLWSLYARLDLIWMLRDARSFLAYSLSDLVLVAAGATAALLLAARFDGIGEWTRPQVVFLLGYGVVARRVLDVLFGYNVSYISRRIGRGQLDHTLVQPLPLWQAFATEGFAPFSGSATLLPGIGLLLWAMRDLGLGADPAWLALFGLSLAASAAVIQAFFVLWGSLAFWAPRAAEEINTSTGELVSQLKVFPLDGAGPLLLGALGTILPVGFAAWYPSRALLGLDPWPGAPLVTPLAALFFSSAAAWVFSKGLEHYGRVGSWRYSDFGHRR